jgi:hypothetical protein
MKAYFQELLLKLKGMYKSWTIWFNSMMALAMIAPPILSDSFPQLQSYLPEGVYKWASGALIIANIMLRFKTIKSLADK